MQEIEQKPLEQAGAEPDTQEKLPEGPLLTIKNMNPKLVHPKMKPRQVVRMANDILGAASLRCTELCNQFFKFVAKNKDDIAAQGLELVRLDAIWKQYIRSRSDKLKFAECAPFFLQKMNFMIGDKAVNEAILAKVKDVEEKLES